MMDVTSRIKKIFDDEQKSPRWALVADDVPTSYDLISSEWLTQVLSRSFPGVVIASHHLDAPDNGASNRRRIFLSYAPADAGVIGPSTVFCKASFDLVNRLLLANSGSTYGEVKFYNDVRPTLDIESPKCCLAKYDPNSFASIIVLEDMSARGASFCQHTTRIDRAMAEGQLSLLAKLHGSFYGRLGDIPALSDLRTFEEKFEASDSWWDLQSCCSKGFHAAEAVIPPRLYKRHAEIWPATRKAVDLHAKQTRTFTHNDTHLRNWYVLPDGKMGLSDWQGINQGDWGRDVANVIATSLTVEDRRLWEKDLLQFYLNELHAYADAKVVTFDVAWNNYRQHLFTALAMWTMTLTPTLGNSGVPAPELQPRDATLEFIKRMATAIDDLDALSGVD